MGKNRYQTVAEARAGADKRRADSEQRRMGEAAETLSKRDRGSVRAKHVAAVWNTAAMHATGERKFYCPALSKNDEGRAKVKLNELLETQPEDCDTAEEFLRHFFTWVIEQWSTLPRRHGTEWMHKKHMLPRHPEMTFVVHHWKFLRQAYEDRFIEKGYDYVTPEVDELREALGVLERKLLDKERFSERTRLKRLQEENAKLKRELNDMSAKVPVDLDTDLPAWEEEPND